MRLSIVTLPLALGLVLCGGARAVGMRGAPPAPDDERAVHPAVHGAQHSAVLAGRVVDASGLPLARVRVLGLEHDAEDPPRLLDASLARARAPREGWTDVEGRFELAGLSPGPVRIALRLPGYAARDVEGLGLAARGRTDAGVFTLLTARLVAGRVVDANGDAVPDATLFALAPEAASGNEGAALARRLGRTDSSGSFLSDELDDGAWTLLVQAPDLPETRFPSAVPARCADVHVELALHPAASVAGMAVARPDGWFERVVVHALPLSATDAPADVPAPELFGYRAAAVADDGSFELVGLRAGESYSLHALPEGVPPRRADRWSAPRLVASGSRNQTLELAHGARVHFRVVDGATEAPLERFEVRLFGAFARRARADDGTLLDERERPQRPQPPWVEHAGGRVALEELRPERDAPATLVVTAAGYAPAERTLELAPGARLDLGDVHLAPVPTLEVEVLAAATGEPVRDALLSILVLSEDRPGAAPDPATQAYTGADGVGRVADRPTRARLLGVRAHGFAPVVLTSPFPTRDDTSETVVVRLEPGASASVRVTGPDGAPLLAAPVVHELQDEHLARFHWSRATPVLTETDGVARFFGLAPGLHRFAAGRAASPAPHEWAPARLDGRETVEVALGATPLVRLEGFVTEAGRPLAGATVALSEIEGGRADAPGSAASPSGPRRTRTDTRGAFELFGLAPGTYLAEWSHPARALPWWTRIELAPEPRELRIDLPLTVLTGSVRDEHGRPVVGALLELAADGAATDLGPFGPQELDVFDPDAAPPPFAHSDGAGGFALRGVNPEVPFELVARDPRTDAAARVRVEALGTQGFVGDVELVLVRAAALRVAPAPPGLAGPHALLAAHVAADGTDGTGAPARAVVPYSGGEAVFAGLAPGTWTLTVAALDGFGRVSGTWELATVELAAGEERVLVLE